MPKKMPKLWLESDGVFIIKCELLRNESYINLQNLQTNDTFDTQDSHQQEHWVLAFPPPAAFCPVWGTPRSPSFCPFLSYCMLMIEWLKPSASPDRRELW
jgi:hypothetical protein